MTVAAVQTLMRWSLAAKRRLVVGVTGPSDHHGYRPMEILVDRISATHATRSSCSNLSIQNGETRAASPMTLQSAYRPRPALPDGRKPSLGRSPVPVAQGRRPKRFRMVERPLARLVAWPHASLLDQLTTPLPRGARQSDRGPVGHRSRKTRWPRSRQPFVSYRPTTEGSRHSQTPRR